VIDCDGERVNQFEKSALFFPDRNNLTVDLCIPD